jgi:hypothetical protein
LAAHATAGQLDRRPPIIQRFRSMIISVVSVGKNESEIIDKLKSLLFSLLAGEFGEVENRSKGDNTCG